MGNFLSIPILALAAILQASIVPQIRILGGGPDLIFLLVLAWAINARLESSVIWAFVGGIMQDLMSAAPLGTSTVGLLLLVFAISGLGQQVHKIGFIIMLGLVLFGTLAQQIIIMLVLAFSGFTMQWGFNLTFVIAPTILYNLVLIWPVYWFVLRLQRRVSRTGSSV
ncbi:MAG: rod shape-determining protein MreD [Phototrophicaceae bacterium]